MMNKVLTFLVWIVITPIYVFLRVTTREELLKAQTVS